MKRLDPLRYNVATIQSDDLPIRESGEVCNQAPADARRWHVKGRLTGYSQKENPSREARVFVVYSVVGREFEPLTFRRRATGLLHSA